MENHRKIRVILIDDHSNIHKIVTTALMVAEDIELIGHGNNGTDALTLCAQHLPDIVLMDVVMPVMDGIEATTLLRRAYPGLKILVLSSFQDDESVHAMLANGANAYILKGSLARDLVATIRMVWSGHTVLAAEVTDTLLHAPAEPKQKFGLTHREAEVLRYMASGLNNGEIAAKLSISASTVKFHIANILQKMGVETRPEAIVLASKNNLI
jgi:two-component system, NarL family, response regulator LiaR